MWFLLNGCEHIVENLKKLLTGKAVKGDQVVRLTIIISLMTLFFWDNFFCGDNLFYLGTLSFQVNFHGTSFWSEKCPVQDLTETNSNHKMIIVDKRVDD